MLKYDAFISYSHALDKPVAQELQRVIQMLGKPWHKLRASRIFRDDTSLTASPDLWPSIVAALEKSKHLIVLASPEAGRSPWVNKEVEWWLENRGADSILVGLTGGALVWSEERSGFLPGPDYPLPPALDRRFSGEPLWIDLRPWRNTAKTASGDSAFSSLASKFAAHLRGIPLEDLWSEELRQQRRNLRLAGSAVAALVALTIFGAFWLVRAINQERQAHASESRAQMQLAILNSERSASGDALKAALEGVEAAGKAGKDLSELENDLYQVSSKVRHGLLAAGRLQWPDALKTYRIDEMHFVPGSAEVCLRAGRTVDNQETNFETCFAEENGAIAWRPDTKPEQNPLALIADSLDTKIKGKTLEFRSSEEAGSKLVYATAKSAFGDFLDEMYISAKICPDARFIITQVVRFEKGTTEGADSIYRGSDVYVIETGSKKVSKIDGEFWIDTVTCSPAAPIVAGAGQRGHIKFYDVSGGYVVAESESGLARFASESAMLSFDDQGHVLIPSMLEIDGASTAATLISLELNDDPTRRNLTFPPFGGAHADVVALSRDGKYAALLHRGEVLTIWDLAAFGIGKTDQDEAGSEQDEVEEDWDTKTRRIDEAVAAVRLGVSGADTLACIIVDEKQPRAIAFGKNRLVTYDLGLKRMVSDKSGTVLNFSDDACSDDGYTSSRHLELIALDDSVEALCDGFNDRPACQLFRTASGPHWLNAETLPSTCHAVFRSKDLWLCGLGDPGDEETDTALAIIHWTKQKALLVKHDYFDHIFAHQLGLADFAIRRSDACSRILISYSNWQRGGGAPQPHGALILDTDSGAEIAQVLDKHHPLFCNVDELVEHLRVQSRRYTAQPVAVGLVPETEPRSEAR